VTQLPNGIDTSVPHPARVYDYWLGGKDNFAADRRAAEAGYKAFPGVVQAAHASRAFLGRVIRYLVAEAGIRQFLDVGSGLPAASNTHEIAQEKAPDSRVVYVDIDPVVVLHARVLLRSSPEGRTDFLQADARDPAAVLAQAAQFLDFGRPAAVLLLGLLHDYPDDAQVAAITAAFAAAVAPGSYLAVSHLASDLEGEMVLRFARTMGEHGLPPGALRSREQVAGLLAGLDLVGPGVVPVSQWRPDTDLEAGAFTPVWGAVARKPGG
jgi:O-methyltransferase involved in polyketide biosynthesis